MRYWFDLVSSSLARLIPPAFQYTLLPGMHVEAVIAFMPGYFNNSPLKAASFSLYVESATPGPLITSVWSILTPSYLLRMYLSWVYIVNVPEISAIDTANWNTTRTFLIKAPPEPPFSFPWKIDIGLNDEITREGYNPDMIGPARIIIKKTTQISIVFRLIALPVSILK